jgi:hypothetical protein
MTVIFAIPRHEYASYRDLYTLIDLSGFQKCYIDEIDPQSENAYIITILNGEVPAAGYPDARAQIALWDNEWHLDGVPPLVGVTYWAADKWYAERIGAKYVPMGSHVGLKPEISNGIFTNCELAFIGYFDGVPRRQVIRQQLIERGVRVSPPGGWGDVRDAILKASRAYLHVHQLADAPTIAPLRMVVAAAYKLPVISEEVADAAMFSGFVAPLIEFRYEYLAEQTQLTIQRKASLLQYQGETLHQFLCHDFTFAKSVEAALS